MRAIALLSAIALLAGCTSQPAEQSAAQNEAQARVAATDLKGAERMFGFPTETIGRINQFGFRLGDYVKADAGYAATGEATPLSQPDAKTPNRGTVTVTGPDSDSIGAITFSLALTDTANADAAKARLSQLFRSFLFQYGLDDEGALDIIDKEQAGQGTIDTAAFTVAVDRSDAGRTLTVTFNPSSATARTKPVDGKSQQP